MRQDVVTKAMAFDWYEVWIEGENVVFCTS